MLRTATTLAIACGLTVAGCGSDLPDRPDAYGPSKTTTTTSTSTTTTTTTTTTLPAVPVPAPVKLGAVCTVPGGVSDTAENVHVFCLDRKSVSAKPFSGGKLRWIAAGI